MRKSFALFETVRKRPCQSVVLGSSSLMMPIPGRGLPVLSVRSPCLLPFHETCTNMVWVSSIGTQARAITWSSKSPSGGNVQKGNRKWATRQYVCPGPPGR